jgi:hypothetical protein
MRSEAQIGGKNIVITAVDQNQTVMIKEVFIIG